MEYLENKTFDEIKLGDTASLTRTLTEKDIQVFAIMSGDINPAHVDQEYAQSDLFHKIIGHGMWGGALISTVLGTQLPGPGTIYVTQSLRFKKPVAIGDTLTVTVTVKEKKAEKRRVILACTCHNQIGDLVMEGEAEVIAPSKKIRRPKAVLPEINLRRTHTFFDSYLAKAQALSPVRTGIIHPVREKIIEAAVAAYKARLIEPIFIGPKDRILACAESAKIDIGAYEIIATEHSHAAATKAVKLARTNELSMLVRGGLTREELLHAMQKPGRGLMEDRYMSHALVLDVPTYPKPLILTDTIINLDPNLDMKKDITQNAIDLALALGITDPKVAILSAMSKVNANVRSTIDAAALCKMADRGQIRHGILDGPLTFDHVIYSEKVREGEVSSSVVGQADILVVPNVETGNILEKQLEFLAESRNAGLVLGALVPVLMSHIYDTYLSNISCALALLYREYQHHYVKEKRY